MNQKDLSEAEGMDVESLPEALEPAGEGTGFDAEVGSPVSASPEGGAVSEVESVIPASASAEEKLGGHGEIAVILESIRESVELQREMRTRDQDTIAELKSEVVSLRSGELRNAQRPLLSSLARLCDSVDKALEQESTDQEMLAFLREGLLDALESTGLSPVEAPEGHPFIRGQHRVAGRVETSDEERDLTIARLRREGFLWPDGEVFRPAEVDVFVFVVDSSLKAGQERNELER